MYQEVAENVALLDLQHLDNLDEIELRNIRLRFPLEQEMEEPVQIFEYHVPTDRGNILVAVQGDRSKPAILTYHDLGLNHASFRPFFNYKEMREMCKNFCVFHVNAPGQEDGAANLPSNYIYPNMDELANQLLYVIVHFGIRNFIGFGVGAGANILARFALVHPAKVDALVLINCTSTRAGWIEWAYQKMNIRNLRAHGMTQSVVDYLMWHHFGRSGEERNLDLTQIYKVYFTHHVNPNNLSMFINSYIRRSDLEICRTAETIQAPVLNITGAYSSHVEDTVTLNSRIHPSRSTWMKISDVAMVLDEKPSKTSEAFRLFLQGEGFVAPLSPTETVALRRRLCDGGVVTGRRPCLPSPVIRITENPIPETVVC